MTTAIVWFRRDLRLGDNPAWANGTHSDRVVPLFVIDPALYDAVSARRRQLLIAGLRALDRDLMQRDARLRIEFGDPATVVPAVAAEVGAPTVHVNREITPYGVARDDRVSRRVRLTPGEGLYVHPPGSLLTRGGDPYRVFTAFHRAWSQRPLDPWPEEGPASISAVIGAGIPDVAAGHPAGEEHALRRLEEFTARVGSYGDTRDRPDLDSTSRLSIDLKYGWLGARTVLTATEGVPGAAAFTRQLAWRDFYGHVLAAYPGTVETPMRPEYRAIEWIDDPTAVASWQDGTTGYPIVDAGMRQLVAEGWIHNRVRLIVASFLVKHLLIDWRRGEAFFRHHLVDADVAQNVGNWQWIAGTGTDAAPYFRVLNPILQSRRFDPGGSYIRRWVPELAAIPDALIHSPWEAGADELARYGVVLGDHYPEPIIPHSIARERALAAYAAARSTNRLR